MKILEPVELNAADFAILVVVGLSCILGLWRGLIREVLSLATWIGAVVVVWLYNERLATLMPAFIEQPLLRYFTAFLVLFLGVMIIGNLLAKLSLHMLEFAGLTVMDRILGGGFGVMRGALIVCVVLYLAGALLSGTEIWAGSALIPYGLALIEWSGALIAQSGTEVVI